MTETSRFVHKFNLILTRFRSTAERRIQVSGPFVPTKTHWIALIRDLYVEIGLEEPVG